MDNGLVRANGVGPTGRNAAGRPAAPEQTGKRKNNKMKRIIITAGIIVLLAIVSLGGWFAYRSSTSAAIDGSKFQAVFFTNGQVYFGKLQTLNGSYMKLTNIFYLQAQTATDASKNPQQTTAQTTSDVKLIKLGSEVHGPNDEMVISTSQILFFENLKNDGKVAQSITTYQQSQK